MGKAQACQDECLAHEVRAAIAKLFAEVEAIGKRLDEGKQDIDAHGVAIRGNGLEREGMYAQLKRLKSDVKALRGERKTSRGNWFSVVLVLLGAFATAFAGGLVLLWIGSK